MLPVLYTALVLLLAIIWLSTDSLTTPTYRPMGKYELSTDEATARHQCRTYFKKFHGKYLKRKSYGKTWYESTFQFNKDPDCATACTTNRFRWECSFNTDDDDRGFMEFISKVFTE